MKVANAEYALNMCVSAHLMALTAKYLISTQLMAHGTGDASWHNQQPFRAALVSCCFEFMVIEIALNRAGLCL
jgi:hypothetical protein